MHHYFESITNKSGDVLVGYFARVIDPSTQNTVTLSADNNGTPIVTVSGVENMAKSDENGNLSLYVAPGTYHLDIYAPNATSFILRVQNIPMNSIPAGDFTAVIDTVAGLQVDVQSKADNVFDDAIAPAYLKTLSDIANQVPVSALRFVPVNKHNAIVDGGTFEDFADNIQDGVDAFRTGSDTFTGGTLVIPRGRMGISKQIVVNTINPAGLSSFRLRGGGMHNSMFYALPGFVGDSMLDIDQATYCSVSGLHLLGAGGNAPVGLTVGGGSHIDINDVFVQQTSSHGFVFSDNFMLTLRQLRSKGSQTGDGFSFAGPHTSIDAGCMYALDNARDGFSIKDVLYSTFAACGSDNNRFGYRISNVAALEMQGCGAEQCFRSAFGLVASDTLDGQFITKGINLRLNGCFGVSNDRDAGQDYGSAINLDQSGNSVVRVDVNGFLEYDATNSPVSMLATPTSKGKVTLDEHCDLRGAISGTNFARKGSAPLRTNVTFETTTVKKVATLSSAFGGAQHYSGLVQVAATRSDYASNISSNDASYVLHVFKGAAGSGVVEMSKLGLTDGNDTTHPSFSWSFDPATNELRGAPIASTVGPFNFHIAPLGGIVVSP